LPPETPRLTRRKFLWAYPYPKPQKGRYAKRIRIISRRRSKHPGATLQPGFVSYSEPRTRLSSGHERRHGGENSKHHNVIGSRHRVTAMEFAGTVPQGTDDSWPPVGAQEFFYVTPRRAERQGTLRIFLLILLGSAGTLARYALEGWVQYRAGSFIVPVNDLLVRASKTWK
jgi:hypothetical protein